MTPGEMLRRAVHLAIGLGAFLVPVIGVDAALVLALIAIPANAWLVPRIPGVRAIVRADGTGTRAVWLYAVAVASLLIAFHGRPAIAMAGWLALGVGDGCAPFVAGIIRGGPRWPWRNDKRVTPSVVAGLIASTVMLLVPGLPARAALAAGLAGACADGLPRPVEDNVAWAWLGAVAAAVAGDPA